MALKHVLLIATGGTVACRDNGNGLAPALSGEQLIEFLPELSGLCGVVVENLFSKDSTDIATDDRVKIAHLIRDTYDKFDGFVIAHGTDTLAYTAALLYHMLRSLDKPVILTGAQKPIGEPGSDAERNLLDAFRVICAGYAGVAAVVHGQVIRGDHVVKVDCEKANAFRSVGAPLDGTVDRTGTVRLEHVPHPTGRPEFIDTVDSDFVLLKLVPDLDPSIITFLSRYKKVIIEGYGSGGIPIRLEKVVQKLIRSGTTVYITTQCLSGTVDLSKYAVGRRAEALGAVSLGNRTVEDAIAAIQCGEI